jgi:NADH-quinone oxidoreductase subunit A
MENALLPVLLFVLAAAAVGIGMLSLGSLLGPSRQGRVKEMPYESGMDPIHDTKRRFDVRFHLVAIAFLLFDVEILFLYPWAVAGHPKAPGSGEGFELLRGAVPDTQYVEVRDFRMIVFGGAMLFLTLVVAGLVYEWRRGVLRWR